jgi:hypothetical protein
MSSTVAIVAISSGATLSAAAISGYFAYDVMRRRIEADERQLRDRFAHERSLHDIDELRTILDEAAAAIRQVRDSVDRPEGPGWADEGIVSLEPLEVRLLIRLGPDDPVTVAVSDMLGDLFEIQDHYASNAKSIRSEESEEEFWDALDAMRWGVRDHANGFVHAAREAVGARLALPEA